MAVGALRAAAERGLRVPATTCRWPASTTSTSSRATQPMLTTVRQPLEEMGRMAVTLLMRLLDRHTLEALHVSLATELVVRDSTGAVPASCFILFHGRLIGAADTPAFVPEQALTSNSRMFRCSIRGCHSVSSVTQPCRQRTVASAAEATRRARPPLPSASVHAMPDEQESTVPRPCPPTTGVGLTVLAAAAGTRRPRTVRPTRPTSRSTSGSPPPPTPAAATSPAACSSRRPSPSARPAARPTTPSRSTRA